MKAQTWKCVNCGTVWPENAGPFVCAQTGKNCTQFTLGPPLEVNRQPQVGGEHYRLHGEDLQVWDLWLRWNLNPFQAIIIKHVVRYRDKLLVDDLLKARQYLDKLIEEESKKENE